MQDPASRAGELIAKIDERRAKVVVVGQGYVGLPGRDARGRGRVPGGRLRRRARIASTRSQPAARTSRTSPTSGSRPRWRPGTCPTHDPDDLRDFDVAVITVQTPLRENIPDLSFIEAAARDLAAWLTPGALVVLESTTYPGTTDELLRPILEESGLHVGRRRLLPRLLARAHRSREHASGRS